ncbi:MAG: hypothetical protein K8H87_04840 [Pseudorhodoplanes sp.]|nr:hypothetical protein [Pseudorhodoplanes sp.]
MALNRRSSRAAGSRDSLRNTGSKRAATARRSTRASEAVVVLAVLQEANAERARSQYLKLFGLDDINDQEVHDLFQDRMFDAIMRDEPTVEIECELAQRALLLVKSGMKRRRGGQKKDRWREMRLATLVRIGRQTKAHLVAEATNATQAHLQAAEEAAEEGRRHGLNFTAGYLGRKMQRAERRR